MSAGPDVAIVGGGVIGLSVAWHLAREGATVSVLEQGRVGGQATGAAAGMLAPLAEAHKPGPFVELGCASLQRYPDLIASLREETDLDPELTGPGMLRLAFDPEEEERLSTAYTWQKAAGYPVEWLAGDTARRYEPALSPTVISAILSPEERHVEPRRLVRVLALACARRGVRIVEGAPVTSFETTRDRVIRIYSASAEFLCGQVVLAGGAWTGQIGKQLGVTLPVFPVRGQILSLSCLPAPMRHTLYASSGYLVPKTDGRVIVGATEERVGFDTRPTVSGMARLLKLAPMLVPVLADAPFDSVWAGLRPGSADGMPILGPLTNWHNVYVATGHFRNGILLAPITGEILTRDVLGQNPHPLAAPFRPRAEEIPTG